MALSHSRNLRRGRHSAAGQIYLVTTCCKDRRRVFSIAANAEILVQELIAPGIATICNNLAYVVMPDHLHWLVQLRGNNRLENLVGQVKGRTSIRINRRQHTAGSIWQYGFHDHAMRSDEDIEQAGCYLIRNPVRAGISNEIDDFPFWDSVWHNRSGDMISWP